MTSFLARFALILILAYFLASCGVPVRDTLYVPVRDTLYSDELPFSGYGAYSYVVLTERPKEVSGSRQEAFCDAYLSRLESVQQYSGRPKLSLMPTFWLLVDKRDGSNSCRELVENYDYARAKLIMERIGKLSAHGPLLVAWTKPFEEAQGRKALVLDLSKVEPSLFSEAFAIWSARITKSPELWNNGFALEKIKLELASFLNKYGDSIVTVIDWFSEKVG
uniref:Lipoprotein n=1 Tax=Candidatus Kentrum sp. TC TaxID=2126339 RepID=A0A450ZQL3_9GAMM|nr:MAG: hypothetical protein BECKTC1821F_GA0114240_100920 [Candidatus Kentron sp. TC]